MSADDWVSTALADDVVVVELLLRLKQSTARSASASASAAAVVVKEAAVEGKKELVWGCRQARSKSAKVKDRDSRCSPTTPLSWSCGGAVSSASPSDESCLPSDPSAAGRSKGAYANDSIPCTSANKRSNAKRTKSYAELQEEETLLLKERSNLKNELQTMHVTLKKQKVKSENFKRLKTDLHHHQAAYGLASKSHRADNIHVHQAKGAESSRISHLRASNSIQLQDEQVVASKPLKAEKGFVLPDLNMMPSEDDCP